MTALIDSYRTIYSDVAGWFNPLSQAVWSALLTEQARLGLSGDILEIGVKHGKSAGMLACALQEGERLTLVDTVITESARSLFAGKLNITLREMSSLALKHTPDLGTVTFRFIHIDGNHLASFVQNDLEFARDHMAPRAVICVDDFFSYHYPQITFTTLEFLSRHRHEMSIFLAGGNKAYICRHPDYRPYARWLIEDVPETLAQNGIADFNLYKSARAPEISCFGIAPNKGQGVVIKGLDTDKEPKLYY